MSSPPAFAVFAVRSVCSDWNTRILPSFDNTISVESWLVGAPLLDWSSVQFWYHGASPVAKSQPAFGVGASAFGQRLELYCARPLGDGVSGMLPLNWLSPTRK